MNLALVNKAYDKAYDEGLGRGRKSKGSLNLGPEAIPKPGIGQTGLASHKDFVKVKAMWEASLASPIDLTGGFGIASRNCPNTTWDARWGHRVPMFFPA